MQAHAGYFEELKRVAGLDKYKAREDFAVVVQPFLEDTQIPTGSDGKPDTSYLAPDCFHFSGTNRPQRTVKGGCARLSAELTGGVAVSQRKRTRQPPWACGTTSSSRTN